MAQSLNFPVPLPAQLLETPTRTSSTVCFPHELPQWRRALETVCRPLNSDSKAGSATAKEFAEILAQGWLRLGGETPRPRIRLRLRFAGKPAELRSLRARQRLRWIALADEIELDAAAIQIENHHAAADLLAAACEACATASRARLAVRFAAAQWPQAETIAFRALAVPNLAVDFGPEAPAAFEGDDHAADARWRETAGQIAGRLSARHPAGAVLRLIFSGAPRPALSPFDPGPSMDYDLALPLTIDLSPALNERGLDWSALGRAVRAVGRLSPRLAAAVRAQARGPLERSLNAGCPVAVSLKGFDSLFAVLGIGARDARARQWVEDVTQFIRAQWQAAAAGDMASQTRWEYSPEDCALTPGTDGVGAPAILAQLAAQRASGGLLRAGFCHDPQSDPASLARSAAQALALGARDLWVMIRPGSRTARERAVAPSPARIAPNVTTVSLIPSAPRLRDAGAPWSALPAPVATHGLGFMRPAQPDATPLRCDRCRAPMRRMDQRLYCPVCHFTLVAC